jgi:multicomponent Na+:H+ antiporter subunit C
MTPNLTLVVVAAVLTGCGVYLLLSRSVIRGLIGFLLMSNGVNVLFVIASGDPGEVPIIGEGDLGPVSDPVPQALVLTAIVITLGMTAFVLALAHRAWQLVGSDLLEDDPESARIHRRAEANDTGGMGSSDSAESITDESAAEPADAIAADVVDTSDEEPTGEGSQ